MFFLTQKKYTLNKFKLFKEQQTNVFINKIKLLQIN